MPNFSLPEYGGYSQGRIEQLDTLKKLCGSVSKDGMVILEIGSWTGLSTSALGQKAKEANGLVYAVDWFRGSSNTNLPALAACDVLSIFLSNMKELGLEDTVCTMVMTSKQAAKAIKDESLDLVFIDGNHGYSAVKEDIELWYPKVRQGGILSGHDCEKRLADVDPNLIEAHKEEDWCVDFHPGVVKAVGERFPNCSIENDIWWVVK
jgi:predicted O-methyltransferase YrrM